MSNICDLTTELFLNFSDIPGYDVNYYFFGRMGVVTYVKNNFLQTLGKYRIPHISIRVF